MNSTYGMMYASRVLRYLSQAFNMDVRGLMRYASNGLFRFKKLAGPMEYPRITAGRTVVNDLLPTYSWFIATLLYASIVLSLSAIAWILLVYNKDRQKKAKHRWRLSIFKLFKREPLCIQALTTIILTLLLLKTSASSFTYYPTALSIMPQAPTATLEQPPYACLTRTSRAAVTYTDFEIYPVTGWTANGGSWSNVSGITGAKGSVLRGSDDGRGLGGASQYYYNTSLSSYSSLWVAAKTLYSSGGKVYYGVALMNLDRSRAFTIELYRFAAVIGSLMIRSYNVTTGGWEDHTTVYIPGYSQGSWYVIAVNYSVSGTTINITAHLYNATGGLVTTASTTITHTNVFVPAYIGVNVNGGAAYFDDLLVATSDLRSVTFINLRAGMIVEIWDNLGSLVASGTALGSSLSLSVIHDVVVGTGVDGNITVKNPDGSLLCGYLVPFTDAILGGDTYKVEAAAFMVELGANKTSARVNTTIPSSAPGATMIVLRVNTSQILYARLILDNIISPNTLDLDLWIEGVVRSTNITIIGGVPVSSSTNSVQLNLGLGNSITINGYFTAADQMATLYLRVEFCTTSSGMGACVYYPIELRLHTSS